MNTKVYIDCELPKEISDEETIRYFKEYNNGDLQARKTLIEHNIRLVMFYVFDYYSNSGYELEDLIQVGTIGLMNAIDTYKIDKNIKFSTYACKCISNEINMYFRKNKKRMKIISLNEIVMEKDNGTDIEIIDSIVDEKVNIVENHLSKELQEEILYEVENLIGRDKEIIKLYYGFYNDRCYSQKEIAKIYDVTPQYICYVLAKQLNNIARQLKRKELLESNEINMKILKRINWDEGIIEK